VTRIRRRADRESRTGPGEHIDLAFAVGEEPRDVLGLFHIDDPMATPVGRNTAKRPTLSVASSACTPDRLLPSAPTSSLMRPSRSRRPTPRSRSVVGEIPR
jgi:hypothetical protein